jgi:hypothetical protein
VSETEFKDKLEAVLRRLRPIVERQTIAGTLGTDAAIAEITRYCLSNADYLECLAYSEQLKRTREEERYQKCLAYMEETREWWETRCSGTLGDLELNQKCWEREARERFGYSHSDWATPCYEGSSMRPLRHRGAS